jgi:hypothetical protein
MEEHGLRIFDNWMHRKISKPKREEPKGQRKLQRIQLHNFLFSPILLG